MTSNKPPESEPWLQSLTLVGDFLLDKRQCKEYELVGHITQHLNFTWHQDPLMSVFQKHFLVRHGVYHLNTCWPQQKQLCLDIGPVDIVVQPYNEAFGQGLSEQSTAKLAGFYLDKTQFYTMRSDEVAELIAGFWQRFESHNQKPGALEVLGLQQGADWEAIKRRYRHLVMTAHPDRGGNAAAFAKISQAYEQLKPLYTAQSQKR